MDMEIDGILGDIAPHRTYTEDTMVESIETTTMDIIGTMVTLGTETDTMLLTPE